MFSVITIIYIINNIIATSSRTTINIYIVYL